MKAMTISEARAWAASHTDPDDPHQTLLNAADARHRWRYGVPEKHSQAAWFSRLLENAVRPWGSCLLWATEWGVWPSSENWPLYYRLRERYGDSQQLTNAPALLFNDGEADDLVNFIQIAVISGWDFCLMPDSDHVWIYVSHDEWVEFRMRDEAGLENVSAALTPPGDDSCFDIV